MGAPRHGVDGLIYISGSEITGANAWSIKINQDSVEAQSFSDRWKNQLVGGRGWSGSIGAWEHSDSKVIVSAATAGVVVALMIYPDRDEQGDYYAGNAIFGMSAAGSVSTGITRDGDFVGDGELSITGFS